MNRKRFLGVTGMALLAVCSTIRPEQANHVPPTPCDPVVSGSAIPGFRVIGQCETIEPYGGLDLEPAAVFL